MKAGKELQQINTKTGLTSRLLEYFAWSVLPEFYF